jgi:hypothetical protein
MLGSQYLYRLIIAAISMAGIYNPRPLWGRFGVFAQSDTHDFGWENMGAARWSFSSCVRPI